MPPDSPVSEEHNSADEYTPLTDENVAILYEIIKSAEQYPEVETLPFRAIFAAYETVLPTKGLDPDHDQIYLRFLFRLGDTREEGQSLYESFEALLEQLGFQIEFVPEGGGIQEVAQVTDVEDDGEGARAQARAKQRIPQRSRRASFNSTYDAEDESTRALRSRPRSRASMSRIDVSQRSILDTRPSTRATTRKTEKTSNHASPSKPAVLQDRRGRLTAEEFANDSQQHQRRDPSVSSQIDRRGKHLTRPRDLSPKPQATIRLPNGNLSNSTSDAEDLTLELSDFAQPPQPVYVVGQKERLYNPSRTQLVRDAETFHHYRIRSIARDIVDRWCYAALQARDQHEHLNRLAAARDTEILLRQAFEHWRLRLHARQQAAKTKKHFLSQERKVTRARNLMLMSKAFTHWAQCAFEERLRATNARQQIISMKYFRAWHDFTLTNKRTVHHQGLRKFFGIWKQRHLQFLANDNKAEVAHRESIARDAYWRWFWTFCERRAPEWRAGRLRRQYTAKWLIVFRENRRRHEYMTYQSEDSIRHRILSQWLEKARVVLTDQRKAVAFRQSTEATHALQSWRQGCRFAPLSRQISNMVDWRVAGATFAVFVSRFRFEQQAEAVSRLRIMRNAWTQWNDRLRLQTVTRRIDDRYCLESLYKWVLAERYILLRRLSQERIKQRLLEKLSSECTARRFQRTQNCLTVEDSRRKRLLQYYLVYWRSRLGSYRQDDHVAFEFYAPKLVQEAIQPWKESLTHLQTLKDLAKDIHYYFAIRRFFKRWNAALLESKRQKRRTAYIQVRRKSKMVLAASVLQNWRSACSKIHDMQQRADLADQNRLLEVGMRSFDEWVHLNTLSRHRSYQASQHYQRRLLERHFYTWIERFENQSKLEELAEVNYDMRMKNIAFSWFNRLRLRIIELKGQEANAENLRCWYEKRHLRSTMRGWQEKTLKRLNPQEEAVVSSRVTRTRPRALPVDEGPTSRAEDWTEFDLGDWIPALEAQSSTTPLPGYLSTPSKRAARAKALVQVSTTPIGTPFEHRLRSQIGSTPRIARRTGFGRSFSALKGNTFGTIMEDSPRTPGMNNEG